MTASNTTDLPPPAPDFPDDDPRIGYNRVWFNLLRIQRTAFPRIARALRRHSMEDPVWHEIMLEIDRSSDGLQMAELERQLHIAQYTLSRHVSRMATAGLIRRERMPGAGRGQRLFLTDAGRLANEAIWPEYMAAIQTEFAHRLSTDEAYALCRVLIRLYP
ncbi:DNA-binding MarR family transcriptional regulator [Pseudorhodobacter sp. 4114]|nr:DNA-binding MarR family transcriptional regulator [Pseudorhodobacter sp. 4114]